MQTQTRQLPKLHTRAAFVPSSLNEQERTVELTWSTGAQVRRVDWWTEREWIEELSLDPSHVRLDRLNNGAPVLPNHRNWGLDDVIGVVEKAWLDRGEGRALVRFSKRAEVGQIFNEIKDGILRNISVGYKINKLEEQKDRQDELKVFRAVDWEPMEISLVTIPADAGAQVRSEDNSNTVILLTNEVNDMTETVKQKSAEERADTPTEPVKQQPIDTEEIRSASVRAERERQKQIRNLAGKFSDRIDAKKVEELIDEGRSFDEAREIILGIVSEKIDKETSRSDASVTTDEREKFIDAGVNAIMARAGQAKWDDGNELRGLRLTELAKRCLDHAGIPYRSMSELEMVKRAFNMDRAITQGTSDFPILLENTMHKTIQQAYTKAAFTWRRWCSTGSVTDFRAHNRYRLGSFGNLDAKTELSEFKNKSIPDGEKASITASTKGNLINISRETIINDDLDAFIALSAMLARAAGRTVEADAFALLASNPTLTDGIALFDASHGNLAGSGGAVSVTTIEAGRVALASQQDISGNDYLDLRPSVWLGGMSSGGTARVTNDSQYDPDTANKLQKPNMVRGLFSDVVDSPRITGTEWYMFADPMDAPVIEVAFLNGDEMPFLDSVDSFNVDGMQWKVRLDYGVAAIDFRGAYKNAGA